MAFLYVSLSTYNLNLLIVNVLDVKIKYIYVYMLVHFLKCVVNKLLYNGFYDKIIKNTNQEILK